MKIGRYTELHLTKLVVFISLFGFSICSQAQPSSWNQVFSSPFGIISIAYGNGTFVGVGGGYNYISHDGTNWNIYTTPSTVSQSGVAFGNGIFMEYGTSVQNGTSKYILQSTNGITWSQIYQSSNILSAAAYGNNTWVFIGSSEIITATGAPTNLVWADYIPNFSPACIAFGNGVFAIGAKPNGTNGYNIFSSSDGITWQFDSSLRDGISNFGNIIYGNGVFAVTASVGLHYVGSPTSYYTFANKFFASSDLVNWSLPLGFQSFQSANNATNFFSSCILAFGGNQFFAVLRGVNPTYAINPTYTFTSSDGYSWSMNSEDVPNISTLTYGQGTFVASGSQNIYQSDAFTSDTNSPAPTTLGISTYAGVTVNGTAGAMYQIQSSTDLNAWQTLTNFMLPSSPYIWVDTSSTVTGQKLYRSIQLQ